MENNNFLNNFSEIILAGVGGMISYFLKYYKEKEDDINYKFSFILFLINMIMGGFVGYIIGSLVDDKNSYHDFIIGMSGIASYPLLLILEGRFLFLLKQYLNFKHGLYIKLGEHEIAPSFFGFSGSRKSSDSTNKDNDILSKKNIDKATGPGTCTPTKKNIKDLQNKENKEKFDNLFN